MTLNASTIVERMPASAFHRFGGDTVVLDPSGTLLRGLNGTGARVWELLDGHKTLSEISQSLAREFQIPLERVEPEVTAFIELLAKKQLVCVKEP